ncbi:lactonase family protein [Glaciimonas soli]|uniref:Beta-propeller fold lactonase family protein n=1 Tax=Glaciimonas soli TaxID=2590999 RepID=A0A843YQV0_9BURK|nr:lactonase family protein [Glaciimonas soli]MQQ99105.1 beta-propeller fold lactonase family protein [Glaciimonas soli]
MKKMPGAFSTLFLLITFLMPLQGHAQEKNLHLLIGTYTNTNRNVKSEGIYAVDFNPKSAEAIYKNVVKNVINPSYLAVSPDKKFVYAVNENGEKSEVSAFSYDEKSGNLHFLNKVASLGADPCYITLDKDGKHVIVANYTGGSLAVFAVEPDGKLSEAIQVIQHAGSSVTKNRQDSPHVHMVKFAPDGKYLLVSDLGTDQVFSYAYNAANPRTPLTLKHTFNVKKGSGPRHLIFSANGKIAYLLHEIDGTLTVFGYHDGVLTPVQETTVAAKNFDRTKEGTIDAADIHLSPDGKFLYASSRGAVNDISIFSVAANGTLSLVTHTPALGKGPRNFAIDPSGQFLLVAHQTSDEVVIFRRDLVTGLLTDSGKRIVIGSPVCLVFVG